MAVGLPCSFLRLDDSWLLSLSSLPLEALPARLAKPSCRKLKSVSVNGNVS